MATSLSSQIQDALPKTQDTYYKLILAVGAARTGKTAALTELAATYKWARPTHTRLPTTLGTTPQAGPAQGRTVDQLGPDAQRHGRHKHMRGVLSAGEEPIHEAARITAPTKGSQPTQANGAGNAYAAASQPASSKTSQQESGTSADLIDEIPF